MKSIIPIVAAFMGLGMLGCSDPSTPSPSPPETQNSVGIAETTPAVPDGSSVSATTTATATVPVAIRPPEFDLSEHVNGNEIEAFLEGLGDQRPFPADLQSEATPLPEARVQEIVHGILDDSRVFFIKRGLRTTTVDLVIDYCDNGLSRLMYWRRGAPRPLGLFTGAVNLWSVAHTELTAWNQPYVTGSPFQDKTAFYTGGWDAMDVEVFSESAVNGLARFGLDRDRWVHIFDHPDCDDPTPVTNFSSDAFDLSVGGTLFEWPEQLRQDMPQLPPEQIVDLWDTEQTDVMTWENLNGFPAVYTCGNRGVVLNRFQAGARVGEPFTWWIEDASDIATNAAWFVMHFDNPDWGLERELVVLPESGRFIEGVFGIRLDECSMEFGLQLAEQVKAKLAQ